jgi:hypothetical protein
VPREGEIALFWSKLTHIALMALCVGLNGGSLAHATTLAPAADNCRYFNSDHVSWIEWLERSQPRGARLVFNEQWSESRTIHGASLRYDGLLSGTRVVGWLRLGLPPFMSEQDTAMMRADLGIRDASRVEAALHPKIIEMAVRSMAGGMGPDAISAVTQSQPVTAVGLQGLARVVVAEADAFYAMAVAVDAGCLSLFGVFATEDGRRQLTVDDLGFLNSSIRVEMYEPAPPPPPKPPPPYRRLLPPSTSLLEVLGGVNPGSADRQR